MGKEEKLEKKDKKKKTKEKDNKKNKKLKLKKRNIIIIISFILFIIISILGIIIYKTNLEKDIKKHYNKYIITTKKTNLYDKNNKKVGNISKDYELELDKNNNKKYYKIKDNNYYIYYKDTKKIKNINKESINSNYIPFNKNIITNKKIVLSKDNKDLITLDNGINIEIEYQDKDNYYVKYLDKILSIKKDKSIKEKDSNNTSDKQSDYISVLYYEKIDDNCSDYSCTSTSTLKEQLSKLKENGYYTISTDDYKKYLDDYIRLKEKAIYIVSSIDNDSIKGIENELGMNVELIDDNFNMKLNFTNKKTTSENNTESIDSYSIKSYTTLDNLIKMAGGEEVVESEPVVVKNTSTGGGQSIAVLNYHFFYDLSIGETNCQESICLEVSKFRQHLDYLKNNNYKTLTMNEFKRWMYGEIELPEKSVLITVDDGAMGTGKHNGNKLIPILEEYKMHATLFLIAGWWDINNYRSPYLDIQSHTYDMHQYGDCGKGQINCATYEQAKEDLRKSLDIIGNDDSFCFPFYAYSDTSLQAVRDSGFKLAFVGGNRKATRNSNKFLIPRYPIYDSTTLQQFINMVS